MHVGRRGRSSAESVVRDGDLVPDGRLRPGDVDRFDNAAIANTVADVALTAEPPTNIALFGPWGSGKSSVYTMIEQRLKTLDKRTRVVRYDAWKYGGRDLKRHFITSVADELGVDKDEFSKGMVAPAAKTKLDLGRWVRDNWRSLLLGLGLAVLLAAIWVVILAGAKAGLSHLSFSSAAQGLIVGSGTVFGLALAALIVGPKVLEGAVVTTVIPPPSGDDEFGDRFCQLMKAAGIKAGDRLVVFIDELDRCTPDDVVATLVDLKTFLEQPGCVFIVAVDRDVVEEALSKVPQAKPVRGDEPYYATRGAFLDKIFQHQVALPPLRTRTLTLFARDLVKEHGGLWQELRNHDQDLFDRVVFALVPVHVRSPRRVKVLLNAYATNVRIAQSRGIDWLERATEIAVLTVLQTEFPEVAADLVRVPRLLAFLRGADLDNADEVRRVVNKYAPVRQAALRAPEAAASAGTVVGAETPDGGEPQLANPAGDLLNDTKDNTQVDVARETTYTQLGAYLTKIAAAEVTDPRRDLFYLQAAGQRDGLTDPALGDVIDAATDTSPDTVVAAFSDQPSSILALAVRLLVIEGEQGVGPGRYFAYESACRLAEQLDRDDLLSVAKEAAPAVLPSSAEPRWPRQAVPGALLIASVVRNVSTIGDLIAKLGADGVDADLLGRAARVLPELDKRAAAPLHSLLVADYAARPVPLHDALQNLPEATALDLWAGVQDRVMASIELMEQPATEFEPASKGAGAKAVAPAAAATPPTGEGRRRLRELIAVTRERTDGEALTSAVYGAAQARPSESLRPEVTQLAAAVLNDIADPDRVNRHVLAGLQSADPAEWRQWTTLLREAQTGTAAVTSTAADVLAGAVLPAVDTVDVTALNQVHDTVDALLPYLDERSSAPVGDAANTLLVRYQWSVLPVDSDPAWWARRRASLQVARQLRSALSDAYVDRLLAADVYTPVREQLRDPAVQAELLSRIDQLEPGPARLLAADLDTHQPRDGDELAHLQLRMRARTRFDGEPISVTELSVLADDAVSTAMFADWLALGPTGGAVAAVLPGVSPTRLSLSAWARRVTDDDRTTAWIALEQTSATLALLEAVGRPGVTAAVVEPLRSKVMAGSRQSDRDDQVARLETATLATGSAHRLRAASELALSLLGTSIGGDARLARRVVQWAGGPAQGYQTKLRASFDVAVSVHESKFSDSDKRYLEERGLLTKRKRLGRKNR